MVRLILLILFSFHLVWAQDVIQILYDESRGISRLADMIQAETEALVSPRFQVTFEQKPYREGMSLNDTEAALTITIGPIGSQAMIQKKNYAHPVIVATVLDSDLQGLTKNTQGTTGQTNFNYIENPFDLAEDLKYLRLIRPFTHLAIMVDQKILTLAPELQNNLAQQLQPDEEITLIPVGDQPIADVTDAIPADCDAVYLLPLGNDYGVDKRKALFDAISEKGLVSFSLLGGTQVAEGVMAGRAPQQSSQLLSRRVALNALAILEGEDAGDQPVETATAGDDFVINLETVEKSGVYPSWKALGQARLLNVATPPDAPTLDLRTAIAQGLMQNLSFQISQLETESGKETVKLAVAELLPELSLGTSFAAIDQARSAASFGSTQPYTWSASAQLDQVLLAEPLLANMRIQQLVQASRVASQNQTELDVILEVAEAYFNILLARSVVVLQNQNVDNTRTNLNLAKKKETVGYSGVSEVYRWETELALNKIELNDAQANWRGAKFRLNQVLNQDQNTPLHLGESEQGDSILNMLDQRLFIYLSDPGQIQYLADFLVEEGKRNLPELRQIQLSLEAQERLIRSRKRAFYLPTIGLNASSGYNIYQGGYESEGEIPPQFADVLPEPITSPTWSVGVGLNIPVFQGRARNANKQQATIDLARLRNQEKDLQNQLELRIRSSLQQVGASFAEIGLAEKAAEAATENLRIAQDGYKEGIVPVAQLIDAQQATLQTQILASNAIYSFLLDFLIVERAIGFYYFLETPESQTAFLERLDEYLLNN
ncbi:MAG: TolC family protein [Bacteroidota bacterium]